MKTYSKLLPLMLLIVQLSVHHAGAQCTYVADRHGDFEIIQDPVHSSQLLLVQNFGDNPVQNQTPVWDIGVMALDAADGQTPLGQAIVVTNYTGNEGVNGPEFFEPPVNPNLDLGILYAGPNGVHAVFRQANSVAGSPSSWTFNRDINGVNLGPLPVAGPVLASSPPDALPCPFPRCGFYPTGDPPEGVDYYAAFSKRTEGIYFGTITAGKGPMISVKKTLESLPPPFHYTVTGAATHPSRAKVAVVACETMQPLGCGVYFGEATGGSLTGFDVNAGPMGGQGGAGRETLRGGQLRTGGVPGDVYWFAAGHEYQSQGDLVNDIFMWKEDGDGLMLQHVFTVNGPVEHMRVVTNDLGTLMMYYQVRSGPFKGSWHIEVDAAGYQQPKKFSRTAYGAELMWIPGLADWRYYRDNNNGQDIAICERLP